MVLSESVRKARLQMKQVDAAILATDISTRVLAIARTGTYAERIIADVPAEMRQRYFEQQGESWQAKSALRQLITFNRLNFLTFLGNNPSIVGASGIRFPWWDQAVARLRRVLVR